MVEHPSLDKVFSALSDPTRRGILSDLRTGPKTVLQIAAPWQMSLNGISKHIKMLERADLVRRDIVGREHYLSLNSVPLSGALNWIEHHRVFWKAKLKKLAEHLESEGISPLQSKVRGETRTPASQIVPSPIKEQSLKTKGRKRKRSNG